MSRQAKRDNWSFKLARQTFEELDNLIRQRWGYGAVRKLERQLGFTKGWWKKHREEGRSISLENTFRVLQAIGRHPREFFSGFPDDESFQKFCTNLNAPPPIARSAVEIFRHAGEEPEACMCSELSKLEQNRFYNPAETLNSLNASMDSVRGGQIPYVLCIAASCFRLLLKYPEAEFCLKEAEVLVGGNTYLKGHVLQRWTYLLGNMGYADLALTQAEKATLLFSGIGNWEKLGESIVDRGWCQLTSRAFESSLELYSSAWGLSSYLNNPNRVACLHGMGASLVRLGEPLKARDYCLQSIEECRDRDPFSLGKSRYLTGSIEKELGNVKGAISLFSSAYDALADKFPVEAMIVGLDLALLHLQLSDVESVRSTVYTVSRYAKDFEDIPQVRDLILDLVATAELRRQIDSCQIVRLRKDVEANRARFMISRANKKGLNH